MLDLVLRASNASAKMSTLSEHEIASTHFSSDSRNCMIFCRGFLLARAATSDGVPGSDACFRSPNTCVPDWSGSPLTLSRTGRESDSERVASKVGWVVARGVVELKDIAMEVVVGERVGDRVGGCGLKNKREVPV